MTRGRAQPFLHAEFPALEKVPPEARVFGFWDQVALWFGAASLPAAWYYGAVMAGWAGLPGAFLLTFVVSTLTVVPWAFSRTDRGTNGRLLHGDGSPDLRASGLGAVLGLLSNLRIWMGCRGPSLRILLALSALGLIPLALLPLLAPQFVGSYIFWLDFLGAIVIPLWTITLVDYFLVKRQRYADDLFRQRDGLYWYRGGWNRPAIASLLTGTAVYWVVAFGLPRLREALTATLPTIGVASLLYLLWARLETGPR